MINAEESLCAQHQLEWIWANCKVVYWPEDAYPIEHDLAAVKDSRELIEAQMPKRPD